MESRIFLGAALLALWLIASPAIGAHRRRRLPQRTLQPPELNAAAVAALGGCAFAAALWWAGPRLLPWLSPTVFAMVAAGGVIGSLLDLVLNVKLPKPERSNARIWIGAGCAAIFGAASLGFALFLHSVPGPDGRALRIASPLRGVWFAASAGRTGFTNLHRSGPRTQWLAVDLVSPGGADASQGQPVFAPIDGTVTEAINDRFEGDDAGAPEGNLIRIGTGTGEEIWLAHLDEDSVTVRAGDRVTAGQPIARVGATGSASTPHLHIHAQRGDEPVPLLFGPSEQWLVRGDTLRGGE